MKQGNRAIFNYFRAKIEQGTETLTEAKLLLLGEGGAGKTSLFRKLRNETEALPEENETTKGIDIHPLYFPMKSGDQFRMNVWDFGGQEVYHATHQFFLNKRSLYVLLDDTRKDDKTANDPAFRYWLQVAELLGGGSPLLIVQNEKGDRSKALDLRSIKGRFEFVSGSLATNLLDCRGLDKVRSEIEHLIQNLPHVGTPLPKRWVRVREAVETMAAEREYISDEDWLALCERHGVDERQALQLSQYLHDVGVFLHFQDDPLLARTLILQKEWATNACYRVLDDETVKQEKQGRFGEDDLARIWNESRWRRRTNELLALMLKFELCYELPDARPRQWLVPQLLPAEQPASHQWAPHGNLALRYRYDFLPKGLLSRIIVRLHRFIEQPERAWRSGAVFERQGAAAEVMELTSGKDLIGIRVAAGSGEAPLRGSGGDWTKRRDLLILIAEEFDRLHDSFHNLKVEKLIPCNCPTCSGMAEPNFYEYSDLANRRQKGKRTVECKVSFEDVNVELLLGDVGQERLAERGEGRERKDGILECIAGNDFDGAMERLKEVLGKEDGVLLSVMAQWKGLREKELKGELDHATATTERNKIRSKLFDLAGMVR